MSPLAPLPQGPNQRIRRGKSIKPLAVRSVPQFKPVRRVEYSYSYTKKLEVLLFLDHYRVLATRPLSSVPRHDTSVPPETGYRPPTFKEAAAFYNIPISTLKTWWTQRDSLVAKETERAFIPKWPLLEEALYEAFIQRRKEKRGVSVYWFKREFQTLFVRFYPKIENLFVFSHN